MLLEKSSSKRRIWVGHNKAIILAREYVGFLFAIIAAFLLRFDYAIPRYYVPHLQFACIVAPLVKTALLNYLGLEGGWWRYFSLRDLERLILGNVAGSLICCGLILLIAPPGYPRSIYILDLILSIVITASERAAVRKLAEISRTGSGSSGKRTLIYGAGSGGMMLLRELRQNSSLGYEMVGFVDDDPQKKGLNLSGIKVLGPGSSLPALVQSITVDEVLIAIPSATGKQMTDILRHCQEAQVQSRMIPGLGELVEQANLGKQIRPVALDDLLGRQPVQLEHERIAERLKEQVILVTGAAGSIGSELCRQISRFEPGRLVAFDIAESGLFDLERSLRSRFPGVPVVTEVGSVQDRPRLDELFEKHRPTAVFHAAAFKHVPLMEEHPFEALQNNVLATYRLATAAEAHGVATFVLISTDKAVRPRSMMGASKRLAELVTSGLQDGATKFVAVRFGNVLGSNGSVVPIFQQQIRDAGPVTVTHPDVARYFMTIPEAAQLVLQTSVMGRGGEIFVLDMGSPVRIVDLARNMILLSGLKPDVDIRIEFTGLRPGEKLFEDLHRDTESMLPTRHSRIKIFGGARLSRNEVENAIHALEKILRSRDLEALVKFCRENLPDYEPSSFLLNRDLQAKSART